MRIQNNILASYTTRQFGIGNQKTQKAAERISSGYRINSAADDAAGLAISEKMRAQIRGLRQAARNSTDAVSLIQTAEGGMQETHAILQRMKELAVQSANGINATLDRNNLQAEFTQLKEELNQIAMTTNFNGMKLLNDYQTEQLSTAGGGSLGAAGGMLSADLGGFMDIAPTNAPAGITAVQTPSNTGLGWLPGGSAVKASNDWLPLRNELADVIVPNVVN